MKWQPRDVSLAVLLAFLLLAAFCMGAFVAYVLVGCWSC